MLILNLQFPWAVGSIMEAVLALVVMTSIDHEPWRWLLGLTSLPILLVILLFIVSNRLLYAYTVYPLTSSIPGRLDSAVWVMIVQLECFVVGVHFIRAEQ